MTGAKRVVTLILAIVIVVGAVTGVAFASAGYQPAQAQTGLYVDGNRVEDASPMLTLGDHEVSFDEYRYYYMSSKTYFESMLGADIWENDIDHAYEISLKSSVLTSLQQKYAWLDIAKDQGVELDEDELKTVQDDLAAKKEEHGSDFEAWLTQNFYTDEEMYVRISEETALTGKAQTQYREEVTEDTGDAADLEGIATAKHILIMPDAEATDTVKARDEALAQAEDLLRQIRESEDPAATFDELMNEYSEDGGLATYPDGYTFGEGEMMEEFYEGALALDVGEISEPVETSYGFHIIMRLPLDEAYLEENGETMLSNQITAKVTELQEEYIEKNPLTEGKYYNDVAPTTMT